MLSFCKDYRDYILEQYNRLVAQKKGKVRIHFEVKIDLKNYVPGSFGTSDCFIYNNETLIVIDFKYGEGVEVSVFKNEQFRLYALGIVGMLFEKIQIETVEMHVYQPRMQNIDSYVEKQAELAEWYKNSVRKQAQLAYEGKGDYVAGKHCGFCPAKMNCKTFAQFNMDHVDEAFSLPNSLDPEFISKVVLSATLFKSWIDSVKEFAISEAQKGVKFPGMKVVEGRSDRYIDTPALAALELVIRGIDPAKVYKPKTINTITELEKVLGKAAVNEILKDYILKPDGAPTLVATSDKRPEYGKAKALSAFKDLINK